MKLNFLLFFILVAVLFQSCISEESKLCNLWTYVPEETDLSRNTNLEIVDLRGAKEGGILLSPVSFLDIHKDGSYTLFFSQYDYGKWQLRDSILLLTNSKNQRTKFIVRYNKFKNLKLVPDSVKALEQKEYSFEGTDNDCDKPEQNPYAKENNLWRLRPTKKETDQQIHQRLLNHLRYWELYFTWGEKNKKESIDVRSLTSPLKIYGNGFMLLPPEEQPKNWQFYFYDEEDCLKSYVILENFFKTEKINWQDDKVGKYKKFASAFQQMQEKIKKKMN